MDSDLELQNHICLARYHALSTMELAIGRAEQFLGALNDFQRLIHVYIGHLERGEERPWFGDMKEALEGLHQFRSGGEGDYSDDLFNLIDRLGEELYRETVE